MFDSPESLPASAAVGGFTPDATLSWLIAYAGPCGIADCQLDGVPGGHTRLYLIPMIGWLHTFTDEPEEMRLRPAVMMAGGTVCDYTRVSDKFKFIAVLRATEDVIEVARRLYTERFGDGGEMIIERRDQLQN